MSIVEAALFMVVAVPGLILFALMAACMVRSLGRSISDVEQHAMRAFAQDEAARRRLLLALIRTGYQAGRDAAVRVRSSRWRERWFNGTEGRAAADCIEDGLVELIEDHDPPYYRLILAGEIEALKILYRSEPPPAPATPWEGT